MEFVTPLSVEEVREYVPEGTKSVCLMASYDHASRLHPNLLEYLRQLSPHFERLILITNTRPLQDCGELPQNCRILMVPNGGWDFGMWSRVLGNLPKGDLERVGLINDSCYIVNHLGKDFARAEASAFEFWGMVKSEEIRPHVQSFFLVAEKSAVADVLEFIRTHPIKVNVERDEVIRGFEIGLSAYMEEKGHELCGLYDMASVLRVTRPRLLPPNPSVFYCDVLLHIGYPLLKKKAMFMNPLASGVVDPYFLRTL